MNEKKCETCKYYRDGWLCTREKKWDVPTPPDHCCEDWEE